MEQDESSLGNKGLNEISTDDKFPFNSDEDKALQDVCTDFAIAAGMAFEHVIGAIRRLVEDKGRSIADAFQEETEVKSLPKRFRCRVCGRWYDFKNEAKACEREHRHIR